MSIVVVIFLVAITLIGHGYIWIAPINRLHAWAGPRFVVDQLTYLLLGAFLILPLLVVWDVYRLQRPELLQYWYASTLIARYTQLCAVWGIGKIFFDLFDRRNVDAPKNLLEQRQRWVKNTTNPTVYGFYTKLLAAIPGNQILHLTIDEKRLAVPALPEKLEGLKIAHVTDVHLTGRIDRQWFETVANEVNRLEADVIAITGDLVENEACWPWLATSLGKLQAKQGVYFILGNHDYFIDVEQTRKILTDAGLTCLSGQWLDVQWNGAQVRLSGNERPWGNDSLDETNPQQPAADTPFHVSLIHTPDQFNWAHANHANLVLAGHTHGGQIRLPILGAVACPSLHGTHYACGVFRKGNSLLHVSRGISGETPFRWSCPPEIALLELTQAAET